MNIKIGYLLIESIKSVNFNNIILGVYTFFRNKENSMHLSGIFRYSE